MDTILQLTVYLCKLLSAGQWYSRRLCFGSEKKGGCFIFRQPIWGGISACFDAVVMIAHSFGARHWQQPGTRLSHQLCATCCPVSDIVVICGLALKKKMCTSFGGGTVFFSLTHKKSNLSKEDNVSETSRHSLDDLMKTGKYPSALPRSFCFQNTQRMYW